MCRVTFTKYYCTACKDLLSSDELLSCQGVLYERIDKAKDCQLEIRDLDGYLPASECPQCEVKRMIEEDKAGFGNALQTNLMQG
ncbi:hypothetical protein FCOIX_1431 [Fusarium coicis]|nr:hypothetical protein FCOIX_1431 [Fusarium coicis]